MRRQRSFLLSHLGHLSNFAHLGHLSHLSKIGHLSALSSTEQFCSLASTRLYCEISRTSQHPAELVEQRCRRVHTAPLFWRLCSHAIEFAARHRVVPASASARTPAARGDILRCASTTIRPLIGAICFRALATSTPMWWLIAGTRAMWWSDCHPLFCRNQNQVPPQFPPLAELACRAGPGKLAQSVNGPEQNPCKHWAKQQRTPRRGPKGSPWSLGELNP